MLEPGHVTAKKTTRAFSATDQMHEQDNALKIEKRAVGLTEKPSELQQWMVSGPEAARLTGEFENAYLSPKEEGTLHNEQAPSIQKSSAKTVYSLGSTMKELGNPFQEDRQDVFILSLTVKKLQSRVQLRQLVLLNKLVKNNLTDSQKCLIDRTKSIGDVIHHNKLPLFRNSNHKQTKGKKAGKLAQK